MRTSIFLFFFLVAVLKTGEALSHETTTTSTSTTSSTSTTTPTTTSTSTTTPTSTSTTSSTSTTTPTTTSTSTTTPTSTSTTSSTSTTTPTTTSTSTTTPTSTSTTSSTSTTTPTTCSPIDTTNVEPDLGQIESGIDTIEGIVSKSMFTADQGSLVEDKTQTITDQVTRLRTLLSAGQTSDVMADIEYKVSRAVAQVGNANNRITVAEGNDALRSEYVTRTEDILQKTIKRLNECINLLEPMNCPLPTTITTRMTTTIASCFVLDSGFISTVNTGLGDIGEYIIDIDVEVSSNNLNAEITSKTDEMSTLLGDIKDLIEDHYENFTPEDETTIKTKVSTALEKAKFAYEKVVKAASSTDSVEIADLETKASNILQKGINRLNEAIDLLSTLLCD
ncbi:uncharacterized protein LOC143026269 [Oratosquilla oratoria]|uniref:uncharacterized protein LOC143026269 n=1 Tax=Oratosquilla oratoria TaxID=337810 RepID=UPI003F75B12F